MCSDPLKFRGLQSFCEKVEKYRDAEIVTSVAAEAIDPEINSLQGRFVTVQELALFLQETWMQAFADNSVDSEACYKISRVIGTSSATAEAI